MPERSGTNMQCPKCNSVMYFDQAEVAFVCPVCAHTVPAVADSEVDP